MKKLLKLTLAAVCTFTTLTAHSYDIDTHFYGTYSMARFAGIRHEIALKIATATQWMDESYISDPLSMILLADVGIKKRRLLHFPGSRVANEMTINSLQGPAAKLIDPSSKRKLKAVTETEADHEFATEMFTEGLMTGHLMKAAAGLHTLEDSFAHAGTIAELGHAHFWHHPDRPYVDDVSVEKYFLMSRSVLRAMVAIRSLLPAGGVDMDVKFGDTPNYQLNGDQLANIYETIPAVRNTVSRKILNDPTFVKYALEYVFQKAHNVKYLNDGYQQYMNNFTAGQDTYQAASQIARSMPKEVINLERIMATSGRAKPTPEYIISMGGAVEFASRIMRDLIGDFVPRPMSAFHKIEKEEDGPVWIKELDLRVANMRGLIKNLYNKDIFFVENNTKDEKGYLKEMSNDPKAMPRLPLPNPAVEYVTYNLPEKREFNRMIFKFLFPKLSEYMKDDLEKFDEMTRIVVNVKDGTLEDTFDTASAIWSGLKLTTSAWGIWQNARDDIANAHVTPYDNNRYYVVPSLLKRQIEKGNKNLPGGFKPLLTNQQLDNLVSASPLK